MRSDATASIVVPVVERAVISLAQRQRNLTEPPRGHTTIMVGAASNEGAPWRNAAPTLYSNNGREE